MMSGRTVTSKTAEIATRVGTAPAWFRLVLAAAWIALSFALILARSSDVARATISSTALALELAGVPPEVVGVAVFALWSLVPLGLLVAVTVLENRARPERRLNWISMPFFAVALSGTLSREEVASMLSPQAAQSNMALMTWTLVLAFSGLAAYGLMRLIRLLADGGRKARASGKAPS